MASLSDLSTEDLKGLSDEELDFYIEQAERDERRQGKQ